MKRGEGGFTLVELLLVVAITGILATVLGTIMFQITNVTQYDSDRSLALHQLQNAASWFNTDGQTAVSASGGTSLLLTMPSGQTITYAVNGTSLTRTSGSSTMTLAQKISSAGFTVSGRTVTMNLTSSPPGRMNVSEQGSYAVYLRPLP